MNKKHFIRLFFMLGLVSTFLLCPMTASAKPAPKKLILNHKKLTLFVGESKSLKVVSVKPKKAFQKVTWKSKKPNIASVSAKGLLLAKKAGKTEILAISKKDPSVKRSIQITVKKKTPSDEGSTKTPSPKPTESSNAENKYTLKSGIHKLTDNIPAIQQTLEDLYTYTGKGYRSISSKKELQTLKNALLKNGFKNADTLLAPYMDANFKNNSLVFIQTLLFRAYDEQIKDYTITTDKNGKCCCTVTVQYKRLKDDPDVAYVTVMDEYLTVLELPKKELSKIDYFKCETILIATE